VADHYGIKIGQFRGQVNDGLCVVALTDQIQQALDSIALSSEQLHSNDESVTIMSKVGDVTDTGTYRVVLSMLLQLFD
jgi:hypothetical protein